MEHGRENGQCKSEQEVGNSCSVLWSNTSGDTTNFYPLFSAFLFSTPTPPFFSTVVMPLTIFYILSLLIRKQILQPGET